MLPAAELDQLRTELERSLPDTCAITRVTVTQGEGGFPVETETTAATVACRISPEPATTRERMLAERLQLVAPFTITLPAETDVQPSDHIESNGRTFNVASGVGDRSWELGKRVLVDEVT